MPQFGSEADVERWVKQHSVSDLRVILGSPEQLDFKSRVAASGWLTKYDEAAKAKEREAQRELDRRAVEASERSAEAAHRSAHAAWVAIVISIAALLVAAWQHMPWSK